MRDNDGVLPECRNDWKDVDKRGRLVKFGGKNTWKFDSTKGDSENKFRLIEGAIPFLSLQRKISIVEAAAVAGQDDWEDLTEPEEFSADAPFELHGKIKLERKIFGGTKDYPTTFGETKNIAQAHERRRHSQRRL